MCMPVKPGVEPKLSARHPRKHADTWSLGSLTQVPLKVYELVYVHREVTRLENRFYTARWSQENMVSWQLP